MERKLPPIPSQMFSSLGPLPVTREPVDQENGVRGEIDFHERSVWIGLELVPVIEWQTYFHEMIHLALFDAGLHNQLTKETEESICDAIGNYLAAAVRAGHINVKEVK